MIRRIFILGCTAGGVWGALRLLSNFVARSGDTFELSGEGVLLAIPVVMVGAAAGALVGAILFPSRS